MEGLASHRDVRDFCLGYATMTMWLDADSPWAARQTVDVAISSDETSQSSCSAWQQRGIDAVLPEGELELHHTFERTTLTRGFKAIELGKTYDNRPQANDLNPDDDELEDWGVDGTHLPDNSTVRTHPLDQAMTCISEFSGVASGAVTALENDGYVWRAVDQQNGSATEWNISWVDSDTTAGWLHFRCRAIPATRRAPSSPKAPSTNRSRTTEIPFQRHCRFTTSKHACWTLSAIRT